MQSHLAFKKVHQNLAVILCQFSYGKNSFIVLVPDWNRSGLCRKDRTLVRRAQELRDHLVPPRPVQPGPAIPGFVLPEAGDARHRRRRLVALGTNSIKRFCP